MEQKMVEKSQPIGFGKKLPVGEPPRALTFKLDFSSTTSYDNNFVLGDVGMSLLQTCYIDNTTGTNFVYVTLNGQNISCAPGQTSFTPVITVGGQAVQFHAFSLGGALVTISLINIAIEVYGSLTTFSPSSTPPSGNLVFVTNPLSTPVNVLFPTPIGVTQGGAFSVDQHGSWTVQQGTPPWQVSQSATVWVENVSQFGGNAVVTGVGSSGAGIPRFTLSNDSVISSITNKVPLLGPANTSLALNAATVIKVGSGFLFGAWITVAGAAGTLNDSATVLGSGAANVIAPTNAAAAFVNFPTGGVPFTNGLVYNPGAGQSCTVFWT